MTSELPSGWEEKAALALLRRLVRRGDLRVHCAGGQVHTLGKPADDICAAMTLPRLFLLLRMLAKPDPVFLNAFVDGKWCCPEGEVEDLLFLLVAKYARAAPHNLVRRAVDTVARLFFHMRRIAPPGISRRRVAHHYDWGDELYLSFLDEAHTQYSCAFFDKAHPDLASAQQNKIDTTLARLRLDKIDGDFSILDIGCGWGGLTRAIIRRNLHARALGLTLSERQFRYAMAMRERLPSDMRERLSYELADYRKHLSARDAVYARIVSVGMFEHVGLPQYGAFFAVARRLLKPGGLALIHTIVRPCPGVSNAWVSRNIFPGGYIPTASQVLTAAEKSGLLIAQAYFHGGENYQKTLRAWRENYRARKSELSSKKYDARFHRLWEMYLAVAIHTFSPHQDAYQVMQVLLKKQG